MLEELERLRREALGAVAATSDEAALRDEEVRWLGQKGDLVRVLRGLRDLDPAVRPRVGAVANEVRAEIGAAIGARRDALDRERIAARCADPWFDATLPGEVVGLGALHPVTRITYHVEDVFRAMGFHIFDYPQVETEFHNFEGLNIPADHPARDMQDTFWLTDGNLLRTHTSPGQVRTMRALKPPFRAIFPGRTFRQERTDASHEHTFHQVEGLMVGEGISVANLIHSMKVLVGEILEREVTIRLRPGFFPFVEPGFELDMQCQVCQGSGCSVCKRSGWVEILPCGLVHPNVLRHGGVDPEKWSGWAFGLGLSRLVMMKYQIEDIRHLLGGELRFLQQFRHT